MHTMRYATAAAMVALACRPVGAEELTGTLRKVKETGTIILGYRESSVPFSYIDADQKPVGYSLDICYRIVDAVKARLGLEKIDVRLSPVSSAIRVPLIANGTIDIECGSTTNTIERKSQVAFTNTDFLTATRYVSRTAKALHTVADLKGRTVVSISGTINLRQLIEANTRLGLGVNILTVKDHSDAFLMVETERADAFVMDDVLLASLVASSKTPRDFQVSTEALSRPEPYAIMLRRDDAPFKAVADAATKALFQSPEGAAIYAKWFERPIPPRNVNLDFPMSAAMKRAFASPKDSPDPAAY